MKPNGPAGTRFGWPGRKLVRWVTTIHVQLRFIQSADIKQQSPFYHALINRRTINE
jgi:hypothetical protein